MRGRRRHSTFVDLDAGDGSRDDTSVRGRNTSAAAAAIYIGTLLIELRTQKQFYSSRMNRERHNTQRGTCESLQRQEKE